MSTLQRLAALTDATANLKAQLRELNELREQVRKAELSARRSRPISQRKITFNNETNERAAPSVSATASITFTLSIGTRVRRAVFVCYSIVIPSSTHGPISSVRPPELIRTSKSLN